MKKFLLMFILGALGNQLSAQNITVTGTVTGPAEGEIPGVTVFVSGTSNGTLTDIEGNYLLIVSKNDEITFSYVGYKTQVIPVNGRSVIDVNMEEDEQQLDEVVVVGYGTQKKASVVGSISSINMSEVTPIASANLSNSLAGRIPGVISVQGQGRPGNDNASINIRGMSTINDSAPLVLVDGIESDFNRVNPNDIESFTILKDASATAVYGVRGANGVILIVTKRGSTSKPQISANAQFRLHNIVNYPNFLGSYEFAKLKNEANVNIGGGLIYTEEDLEHYRTGDSPYTHPDVDWKDAMTEDFFPEQRYDISLRGGTEKVKYFVSGEFVNQKGAYKQFKGMENSTNTIYNRFNLRMNYDFALTNTTTVKLNLNGRIQETRDPNSGDNTGGNNGGAFWDNISWNEPDMTPLINPNGSIGASSKDDNTMYARLRAGGYNSAKQNELQGRLEFNQKLNFITKGLGFRLVAGNNTNIQTAFRIVRNPATFIYDPADETYARYLIARLPEYAIPGGDFVRVNGYSEAALTYDRVFGKHAITALTLYNQFKNTSNANPFTSNVGFAGRVTYAFDNKYLAEVNLGYNGSSQFESQERFALFPSLSGGYVISQEGFFQNLKPFMNYLKLRGSYGLVGNDRIGNNQFLYLATFDQFNGNWGNNTGYSFGSSYNNSPYLREASLANEAVGWEISRKMNLGADLGFFEDMVSITLDVFKEERTDILSRRNTITSVLGVQPNQLPAENIGKINNQGMEVQLGFNKKLGNSWTIKTNGNFTYAKNTIKDIDEIKFDEDYRNQTGKSIGQNFGYTWTGEFYTFKELGYVLDDNVAGPNKYVLPAEAVPSVPVPETPTKPGDLKFVDRNNDGIIDDADIGAIGYANTPQYIYGLNTIIQFKNWKFSMFWQGGGNFTMAIQSQLYQEFLNETKVHEVHLGRWAYYEDPFTGELVDTREGATYPRLEPGGALATVQPSTFNRFDATYVRLKNIELSYSLPTAFLQRMEMDQVTVFLTANNVATFSALEFVDPESSGSASFYPQTRFFGAGLNLSF